MCIVMFYGMLQMSGLQANVKPPRECYYTGHILGTHHSILISNVSDGDDRSIETSPTMIAFRNHSMFEYVFEI